VWTLLLVGAVATFDLGRWRLSLHVTALVAFLGVAVAD
jgi:hypothetical protein